MTQAYNLSQLANNLDSSGRLDATDGLVNAVPVANGGTGASSSSAARTNLGVAAADGTGATGTWPIGISGSSAYFGGQLPAYYQTALGFTPVQQGGGAGQLANKVYIGWTGSQLKAQVDSTDMGAFVMQPAFTDHSLSPNGYQKLPGGLILQWGSFTQTGETTVVTIPIVFPNAFVNVQQTIAGGASVSQTGAGIANNQQFVSYRDIAVGNVACYYFAIGY